MTEQTTRSTADCDSQHGVSQDGDSQHGVTLEILRNSFFAIVRQAGRIILRSSFSPIIRDAFDFCVTVIGPVAPPRLNLDVVAMNESLAHFSGVMPFMVRNMLWEYGIENLEPGDLIAMNHPHKAGNHVYDNGFFKPVFHNGQLLGGVAVKAHLMDMGGVAAGGYAVTKRNVWEEGLIVSGVPVYKHDKPYIPGFNLYFDNGRLPDNMLADLQALYSAASFAEQRLLALAERYGPDTVHDAMAYTLDYSDRSMREGLRQIPDGEYVGEDGLDADAFNDQPYKIKATARKRGERIEIDFSGTTREAQSSINCSVFDAANGAYTAMKFICDPKNPNSSGAFRAVDVVIPEGTFIGARPPAPTTMYFDAAEAVFNAVTKALLPALGEAGFGGHYSTNMGLLITGMTAKPGRSPARRGADTIAEHLAATAQATAAHGVGVTVDLAEGPPGSLFVAPMLSLGAFGASSDGDGENFVSMSQQNLMDMSVESIEEDHPVMVLRKEYAQDTAGPGQFRGGSGVIWDRVVRADAEVRPLLLHMRIQPWAAYGGAPGRPAGAWIADPGPVRQRPNDEFRPIAGYYDAAGEPVPAGEGEWVFGLTDRHVAPGTAYRVLTPGGGGWGDPLDRDPQHVLDDVRNGFVSITGARGDYGVVVTGDPDRDPGVLAVDDEATTALRAKLREGR